VEASGRCSPLSVSPFWGGGTSGADFSSFWDWLTPEADKSALPLVIREPSMTVEKPLQQSEKVPNPLVSYTFHPVPKDFGPNDVEESGPSVYFASWTRTYRWPTSDKANPKEQYQKLDECVPWTLSLRPLTSYRAWFDGFKDFYLWDSGDTPNREGPVSLSGDQALYNSVAHLFTYPVPDKSQSDYFGNVYGPWFSSHASAHLE
jgi:hypothetical protein